MWFVSHCRPCQSVHDSGHTDTRARTKHALEHSQLHCTDQPPSMLRHKPMRTTQPEHLAQTPHLTHEHQQHAWREVEMSINISKLRPTAKTRPLNDSGF